MPDNGSFPMNMEEARGWLRAAVETRGPEFVYYDPQRQGSLGDKLACSYFPRSDLPETDSRYDTPCLIGVAMRLAGRELDYTHECQTPDSGYLMREWNISPEAAMYLRWAQSKQDVGHTWGEALAYAEERAEAHLAYRAKHVRQRSYA